MNKAETEKRHFKKRVFERYNITITDNDYEYLVSKIKKNDKTVVKFLTKQTNRISIQLLTYKDYEIVVVYDKMRKQLVSALPSDCKDVNNIVFYASETEEF